MVFPQGFIKLCGPADGRCACPHRQLGCTVKLLP